MADVKVDRELLSQLDASASASASETAAGQETVAAVFTLKPGEGRVCIPPDEVEGVVDRLLDRACKSSGEEPGRVKVFKNMGAFAVSAAAPFIRTLLDQDELATATANRQPQDMLIRPVHERPTDAPRPGPTKKKG